MSFVNETDCNYTRTSTLPQLCLFKKIIKLCLVFFCAEKSKEKDGGFQQTFVKDSMLQLYFLTN